MVEAQSMTTVADVVAQVRTNAGASGTVTVSGTAAATGSAWIGEIALTTVYRQSFRAPMSVPAI